MHLLIASPTQSEHELNQSVILLLQHDENGTHGVILNRPANDDILNAWRKLTGNPNHSDRFVQTGGLKGGPVFAVHQIADAADVSLNQNLYVSLNAESVVSITKDRLPYRIFFGVTSWEPGELNREIEQGQWLPVEADDSCVFADPETLWFFALLNHGRQLFSAVTGVAIEVGYNAELN
jgi:putative transcriptional regulator